MLLPSLLDSNKNLVIGRFNKNASLKAITLKGNIIGYIALSPKEHLTDAFDLSFIKQSQQDLVFTFLTLFVLLAIIAVLLSRHFVTPIKYLERQIRQLNNGDYQVTIDVKGKDELAYLSLHFNDLAKTLEQNKNSRNTWLANISHELRTPVAILKAEIEAMQDGIRTLNIEALTSLAEEINHLQKLIDDLSTLSNAEIGAMHYQKEKIDFWALLDTNLARHQVRAKTLNISLTFTPDTKSIYIWADETRINQLIDNMINNCFKYTQAPGNIIISLQQVNNSAVLTIDDSYPSVPKEALDKLFDHLYRVESSRNRKTGGSGIGLALCKSIVDAHQGKISADNSVHGGLSICCTLPLII
jgi:two-component system sensor histidine kinase BaeS